MAKMKKESLKTAMGKYEKSPKDKREDMEGARKLQKRDNSRKGKRG